MSEDQINKEGREYSRPWGSYITLKMAPGYQIKIITVNPGGVLSLQKHHHRSEHWIIVQGSPTCTVGKNKKSYGVGEHLFIEKEQIHRLENNSDIPAKIAEVQLGDYLGEDDIVRLEDIYDR